MTMATIQAATHIEDAEERARDRVKRTRRFLLFFKTEWWETVSERHSGNDIHILTTRPIRNVYINGKLFDTGAPAERIFAV